MNRGVNSIYIWVFPIAGFSEVANTQIRKNGKKTIKKWDAQQSKSSSFWIQHIPTKILTYLIGINPTKIPTPAKTLTYLIGINPTKIPNLGEISICDPFPTRLVKNSLNSQCFGRKTTKFKWNPKFDFWTTRHK